MLSNYYTAGLNIEISILFGNYLLLGIFFLNKSWKGPHFSIIIPYKMLELA